MTKLKIGLFGAGGRMGQEIARLLAESRSMEAFVGVDRSGKAPGFIHVRHLTARFDYFFRRSNLVRGSRAR